MKRWSESGPMKVMETSAIKKYQRGRKGIVMAGVSTGSRLEVSRELFALQERTNVIALKPFVLGGSRSFGSRVCYG
jgi:hypothetical protein